MSSLAQTLDALTTAGTLYTARADGALICHACGHRCLLRPGRRGICQVRFNDHGQLRVPWGYAGALQCDPIEKKPFFHLLPSADALTFGMLGCDLHCDYCFPGDTPIITNVGPQDIASLFQAASTQSHPVSDVEIAYPADLQVVTASGKLHSVRAIFKHLYQGALITVQPYYLPAVRCTPDHRIYATDDINHAPALLPARELTSQYYLAIPRQPAGSIVPMVEVIKELGHYQIEYHTPGKLTVTEREMIVAASQQGTTSREIGLRLGKSGSYIRHVKRKLTNGFGSEVRVSGPLIERETFRFPNERRPGIPLTIPLDTGLARLLGYYCAEGSVFSSRRRPNSHSLNFSFAPEETAEGEEVRRLLRDYFGVEASLTRRPTTLNVAVGKSSVALLFKALCGTRAREKHAPRLLFEATESVIAAFLAAYVAGDGHHYANGKISLTTVSRQLAYDVAALALRLGHLPGLYVAALPETGALQGRPIKRASRQYTVVWYENAAIARKVIETPDHYLVPIRSLGLEDFSGEVFNLEVEAEHSYLAGFFAVSNCQNWITSQALRDPASELAGAAPRPVTARKLVDLALAQGAQVIASSYNEPLITAEWAAAVFDEALPAGLKCAFISNGNATPETLDFLRPRLSAYKVDLKTMSDRSYRRLGGVLQHILDTIQRLHALGVWLEVVTLIIPGFNDSDAELREAAGFLAGLSPDIPWHVTAFHPDYQMTEPAPTSAATLRRAGELGRAAGLRYVYAGNLPGQVGDLEDTFCPGCGARLIERRGYRLWAYRLTAAGACPDCGTGLAGIWTNRPETIRLQALGRPRPAWG